MHVRFLGFDIEITMGFWLTAVMFSLMGGSQSPISIVLWALILLVSILIHELGHALAFRAFGIRSAIRLHFLGGATFPSVVLPMTRVKNVIVSLAGPIAGFTLAGVAYAIAKFVPVQNPGMVQLVSNLYWVNLFWSVMNLAPVLPLDGGHVVEHALGPKRYRITLIISALVGTAIAIWSAVIGQFFGVYIFGSAAVQAFIALRETSAAVRASRETAEAARGTTEPLQPATARALADARRALEDDDPTKAIEIARGVLEGREIGGARPQARAIPEVLTILGWAHLARGETVQATEAVSRLTRIAHGDPALVAAVALARGDEDAARRLLEAARAAGDDRKEVFGPLIQILLRKGEGARAAALALDTADGISTEDMRILASMIAASNEHHWTGRIYETVFKRDRNADAADPSKAVDMMRRAVQAGVTDSPRVWADEALVGIDELEHVLPRPT
ncbi:MAG: hypothetical protein HOQ28_16325 [Thermoleophilia bacterium]|nr:hypothetical protein [Thermoleophilia bacterium]